MKNTLLDEILEFKLEKSLQGESLLQIIVAYCEAKDLDSIEIGETLKKDKKFVTMFKQDLINNHEARFEGQQKTSVAEWI